MSEPIHHDGDRYTIPGAGLYEWRDGELRMVEPGQRIKCPDCAFSLTINPPTGVEATLVHVAETTHKITPALNIMAGTTINAEGSSYGQTHVREAFTFDHVGHPPVRSA